MTNPKRNNRLGFALFGAAFAMLGLGYAAVPLYDLFCRVTGFGGTTQRTSDPNLVDANVAPIVLTPPAGYAKTTFGARMRAAMPGKPPGASAIEGGRPPL